MQRCKGPRVLEARCFRRSISLKDLSDRNCPTVSYDPFWLLTLIFPVLAFFFPGLSLCPPGLSLSPPWLYLSPPGLALLLPLRLPSLFLRLPWPSLTSSLLFSTAETLRFVHPELCLATVG